MTETNKGRILVIDDDANLLKMMALLLQRAGYEFQAATNGLEGLSLAEKMKPDLVILDVALPFMKGTEVCRRLRELSPTSHLPILMMSNLERIEDKLAGFQAGADDYVTKPVNPKELLARINALLARSQLAQSHRGRTIALIGAKGGVGVSTVAVNLAAALMERERSVTLVEVRSSQGTLRHLLDVPPEPHFGPLLHKDAQGITRAEVERYAAQHRSGIRLFLAPPAVPQQPLTAAHVKSVLGVLEQGADYLILDLPPVMDATSRRALELADQIILISDTELLSAVCARTMLQTLVKWNLVNTVAVLGVSRVPSGISLTRRELENQVLGDMQRSEGSDSGDVAWQDALAPSGLGRGVISVVPAAPEAFEDALRAGVPLVRLEPAARAARAISDLADSILSAGALSHPAEL
ncbi:MAG: response regulator [Chloroflexota bacterium]